MPSEYSIQQILNIGDLSAVLSSVDNGKNLAFKGGVLDTMLPVTIARIKRALALRYSANPSDSTLRQVAEYLLQLCGPYALQAQNTLNNLSGSLPVITGPTNQSVLKGANATFSVSVTSSTSVIYQWYQNGILIPGANASSYTITNAQLSMSGNTYFMTATNATGTVVSNTAILTVTAVLQGSWYAGNTDYSTQLEANNDSVVYSGTFNITDGQPLVVPFPAGQVAFIVVKYPTSQSIKTHYANPTGGLDQGTVPGLALNITSFGGNNYIFSRQGNQFGINNTSGQITFS